VVWSLVDLLPARPVTLPKPYMELFLSLAERICGAYSALTIPDFALPL